MKNIDERVFIKEKILFCFLAVLFSSFSIASAKPLSLDIIPGTGVTGKHLLSSWFSPLKATNFDTPVFTLDSGNPGSVVLVLGGTHANELAGMVAAMVLVERVKMRQGRLLVVPFANRSALSVQDSRNGLPQKLPFTTASGVRTLFYGDRYSDIDDQGTANPEKYLTPAGFVHKGKESRNLNRTWPGRANGNLTEQLAFALMQLIRQEKVDLVLDMHEARTPESFDVKGRVGGTDSASYNIRLSYTLVAHPKGLEIAALALMDMEDECGVTMKLEESSKALRGLSHIEIGEACSAYAFLSESPNPGQDTWRSNPDVLYDKKYPLTHRVAVQLAVFTSLMKNFTESENIPFMMEGLPSYNKMMKEGFASFLN